MTSPHDQADGRYDELVSAMDAINTEIAQGPPRHALTSRNDSPFTWEQVAGHKPAPAFDMERIQAAVVRELLARQHRG